MSAIVVPVGVHPHSCCIGILSQEGEGAANIRSLNSARIVSPLCAHSFEGLCVHRSLHPLAKRQAVQLATRYAVRFLCKGEHAAP